MNNTKDNCCFDSSSLNETKQINALKNLKYFSDNNITHETSVMSKSFCGIFPNQPGVNNQANQLFKVPDLDNLPMKKANVKKIKSPTRRVQASRVTNDIKANQSRGSLIPRPSFINPSKSLHCSRSMQLNARKELIKKMVYLAECTLKENQQVFNITSKENQCTPVKALAGLTPKKTPRSGGYFVLPEFQKKVLKLEEIKRPIEDFVKKEIFSYSAKSINEKMQPKPCENKISESDLKRKEEIILNTQILPQTNARLDEVLCHCKVYRKEVTSVHERIKNLDEAFESKLGQIPEYKVYNEFCVYQLKKEDLYRDLKVIDEEFRNSITNKMNTSKKLKTLMKKREELLGKQISLLKDFEQVVETSLEKCNGIETIGKIEEYEKEETPKLRRSLRLSKMCKKNEKTPMTKKLKRLDNKSRGIQKSGRL